MTDLTAQSVAIDLSNLCRDHRLLRPGVRADLALLDRFSESLESAGLNVGSVICVADKSLIPLLSTDERRRLRELEALGRLEITSLADERLLELAFSEYASSGTLIASMDNFDDFRRRYPEIQGSRDRFLAWYPTSGGSLQIQFREMGNHTHRRLSRKEESAELKARRLLRHSIIQKAATNYFRCENSGCLIARLWPDRIPELPRYDDRTDQFVCPSCSTALVLDGPRSNSAQLIVFLDGEEQFRVPIEEGQTVSFGRADGTGQIGLGSRMPQDRTDSISRAHLSFSMIDGGIVVEDLASRNGTVLRNGRVEQRLVPHVSQTFLSEETVALPSGITIELSGRSIPLSNEDSSDHSDLLRNDDRATRLLSRRR